MEQSLPPRVTIITVTYNSSAVVEGLLRSIPASVPCILVDNASQDAEDTGALAAAHGARFIENPENTGFGPACNQGLHRPALSFCSL